MRVICAPIRAFAASDAITMREWEALGRFAVRVEVLLPQALVEWHVDTFPAHAQINSIKHFSEPEIRRMLENEGLNPQDWYIHIEPRLPECASLPKHIESWVFHMRLTGEASAAKLHVAGEAEKHEPTLSEQFGKE